MNIKIIDMYDGTVEYYVREDYQTIKEVLKKFNRPEFNKDDGKLGLPVAKRIEKCRISCYKGKWDIKFLDFSIWFDKETVWRFCVAY